MASTKYNPAGGPVTIKPTLNGPMNCGYSIDAYVGAAIAPFKHVGGTMANVVPLVLDPASGIASETMVVGTFQLRAGNTQLVGSNYNVGLQASQDGADLSDNATVSGTLPENLTTGQVTLVLTT